MSTPEWALFYDIETTGSDPERDQIIEVGCVLTEWPACTHPRQRVMRLQFDRDLITSPTVLKMHTDNGILTEGATRYPSGHADRALVRWLRAITGSRAHVIGAGSGVSHFDRPFLRRHLPRLSDHLTYYSIDVGVMRRMCEAAGRPDLVLDQSSKTHRGIDDALFHLQEYLYYRRVLEGAMPPIPAEPLADCVAP